MFVTSETTRIFLYTMHGRKFVKSCPSIGAYYHIKAPIQWNGAGGIGLLSIFKSVSKTAPKQRLCYEKAQLLWDGAGAGIYLQIDKISQTIGAY